PMIRGIHSTLYARVRPGATEFDFQGLYERRYADEPFVDVMPPGSTPETRSVRASNMVRIAVHRLPDSDLLAILVVEDNMMKGASGQAVMVMNILFDRPETEGLTQIPILPLGRDRIPCRSDGPATETPASPMFRAKRPAASTVATAPVRVTVGGEPPRRGLWVGMLAGLLVGLVATSLVLAYGGTRVARGVDLPVPMAQAGAERGAPGPRPSRPTPEISSVLDIDGLWYRVDALEAENREMRAEAARLQAQVDAAESRIQVEKTTAGQLASQVR